MHAFLVAEDFTVQTNRFARRYQGGTLNGPVPVDRLVVDTGGEGDLIRRTMEQHKQNSGKPDDSIQIPDLANRSEEGEEKPQQGPYVTGVSEQALLNWPGMPPRLGRVSTRYVGQGMHRHEEPEPLPLQLQALKSRFPDQKHWRFAVVNAFGTNLGDCVLGMTAMRTVAKKLSQHLDSFVIDMLLGVNTSAGNFDIVGHEPWIGEVRVTGPTLQEFSSYDGYFDFTGLIALPRFIELPIADWYLWWAGLDPAGVNVEDKRNHIPLRREAYEQITGLLQPIPTPRILFNHKASVTLRTCPESAAISLIMNMLVMDPSIHIILSSPLPFTHPRVHDVNEPLKAGTDRFNALVAQVDGVISVDTYSIHAADAYSTPVAGIYASVPPDSYPYYPLHQGILIPGGETLQAFRKSKVTEEEWNTLQPLYEAAWQKLDAAKILETLQGRRSERNKHLGRTPQFINGPHRHQLCIEKPQGRQLPYDYTPPHWERAVSRQIDVSRLLVKSGSSVIVIAPGQSRFTQCLAEQVGTEGKLHIFEPRPIRRTIIAMDLLDRTPQTPVQWYETLPAPAKNIDLAIEEPLNETTPMLWGSSRVQKRIPAVTIDSLELPILSAIFMFAPMIYRVALQSAKATLLRTKANIVCGPIQNLDDVRGIAEELKALNYQCWIDYIEGRPDGAMMLIAVPEHLNVQAAGMKKVVIS